MNIQDLYTHLKTLEESNYTRERHIVEVLTAEYETYEDATKGLTKLSNLEYDEFDIEVEFGPCVFNSQVADTALKVYYNVELEELEVNEL